MIRQAVICLTISFATHAVAEDFSLSLPLDCDLGSDCYIQQYVDQDPTSAAQDHRCGPLSYDGHKGTDFALPDRMRMARGVDVLASAPGIVRGTRDGMQDTGYTPETADAINDRECGNGVVIVHGGGWETQYCHMKKGSITVARGDHVNTGDLLGQVGLSGRTQFPHVHLSVRKDGAVVDPFDPDGQITCGAPDADTLWDTPPAYRPGGVITVGVSDAVPSFDDIKTGSAHRADLPADTDAMVVFGYAFGSQAGDDMTLTLTGPDGVVVDKTMTLDRTQAQFFRAIGKRRAEDRWPAGNYDATVTLRRDGQVIDRRANRITLP